MLRIRPEQLEIMQRSMAEREQAELVHELGRRCASQAAAMAEPALHAFAQQASQIAAGCGVMAGETRSRLVALLFVHGAGLMERDWARTILYDSQLGPGEKVDLLDHLLGGGGSP